MQLINPIGAGIGVGCPVIALGTVVAAAAGAGGAAVAGAVRDGGTGAGAGDCRGASFATIGVAAGGSGSPLIPAILMFGDSYFASRCTLPPVSLGFAITR